MTIEDFGIAPNNLALPRPLNVVVPAACAPARKRNVVDEVVPAVMV